MVQHEREEKGRYKGMSEEEIREDLLKRISMDKEKSEEEIFIIIRQQVTTEMLRVYGKSAEEAYSNIGDPEKCEVTMQNTEEVRPVISRARNFLDKINAEGSEWIKREEERPTPGGKRSEGSIEELLAKRKGGYSGRTAKDWTEEEITQSIESIKTSLSMAIEAANRTESGVEEEFD